MNVLSYRARRLILRNLSWGNIRFRWAMIGLMLFTVGATLVYFLPPFIGLPVSIIMGMIASQFLHTAYSFPYPTEYPWAVRKYDDLTRWWKHVSQPAHIGTFEDKSVLERWVFGDFRYIYNQTGCLIATEQTINWSDTDLDWRYGDPEDIQVIVTHCDDDEHLPWLARLRSPKLPSGNRAEVINDDFVVGHTTHKSS